jgi:hypothetical protein
LNIGLGPSRRWGWSSEVSTPHPHPHPHPPPKNNSESMTNAKKKKKTKVWGKKRILLSSVPSSSPGPQAWLQWSITTFNPPSSTGEPAKVTFTTRELIQTKPGSIPMIHYASSPDVTRSFCGRCGTNLLYVYEARDKKSVSPGNDIMLGTLDRGKS